MITQFFHDQYTHTRYKKRVQSFLLERIMLLFLLPTLIANPITSYGQNPLLSIGGTAYDGEQKTLFTAPSTHDIVVTDLILTSSSNMTCKRSHKSELGLASGATLGQFETASSHYNGNHGASNGLSIQHAFSGGIRIPASDSLTIFITQGDTYGSNCGSSTAYGVRYMLSGYYVAP